MERIRLLSSLAFHHRRKEKKLGGEILWPIHLFCSPLTVGASKKKKKKTPSEKGDRKRNYVTRDSSSGFFPSTSSVSELILGRIISRSTFKPGRNILRTFYDRNCRCTFNFWEEQNRLSAINDLNGDYMSNCPLKALDTVFIS